jgi:hypothetical protein
MTESNMPPPSEPVAPPQLLRRPRGVDELKLELTRVRLKSLLCSLMKSDADEPSPVETVVPTCRGELVEGSMAEDGFQAMVSWFLGPGVLNVTGAHVLTFSVGTPPFDESDAKYYSEINSVILAYPYIRQIIDDLSVKCLGRNLMIGTLDVPRFVQERTRALREASRHQEPSSQPPASGNGDEGT